MFLRYFVKIFTPSQHALIVKTNIWLNGIVFRFVFAGDIQRFSTLHVVNARWLCVWRVTYRYYIIAVSRRLPTENRHQSQARLGRTGQIKIGYHSYGDLKPPQHGSQVSTANVILFFLQYVWRLKRILNCDKCWFDY